MTATTVSRIGPPDWRVLQELRLRALQADRLSFGSTYEREAAFPDDAWREWARHDAAGDETATFVAHRDGQPIGMVAGYRDEEDHVLFHVIAMWVAPEARGQGVGRALLSHAEDWIRSSGGRAVQLNVTTAAPAARRLYEGAGFQADGSTTASRHTPGLIEVSLRKRLM